MTTRSRKERSEVNTRCNGLLLQFRPYAPALDAPIQDENPRPILTIHHLHGGTQLEVSDPVIGSVAVVEQERTVFSPNFRVVLVRRDGE